MQSTPNNTSIHRIAILPMGMVNAHLIRTQRGVILVDAGLPGTEDKVFQALQRLGLGWSDITLIVVTHAHIDHAGNAAKLRKLSGAPIAAHAGDLPYYRQERPMTFCSTSVFARLFLRTGIIRRPYRAFEPDILLRDDESMSLESFGVRGHLAHNAGHTPGSLSVELERGDALVGDLIASGIGLGGIAWVGKARRPPFEENPELVARELLRLVDAGHSRFFMGHGGPLPAHEVRRHAMALLSGR
jgi:hydroxyacylglutathione hydrolase